MAVKFPKITIGRVITWLSILLNILQNSGTVEPLYDANAPTAPAKSAAE